MNVVHIAQKRAPFCHLPLHECTPFCFERARWRIPLMSEFGFRNHDGSEIRFAPPRVEFEIWRHGNSIYALPLGETPECDALNHTQDDSSIQSDCQAK